MKILVIGGGISGISAAKVALGEKHDVTILESTSEPGGLMARIANCRVGFKTFFDEVRDNERLTVIRDARITKVEKTEMTFTVTLEDGRSLKADRIIIATGLTPYDPVEYKGKRVLTSLEYDAVIDQRQGELPADFNKIGFFLCVGSRSKDYPLCSSVCCSYTLREVKWTLQRAKPEITVFYNDLRFFGQEFYMEKAYRDAGVRFVRANSRYFDEDEEGVTVRYYAGGQLKEERFNYVVLAIGLRPNPQLAELSKLFGFSLNGYGFVNEKAPLQTDAKGVCVCGGALEPMNIKDSILTGFGAGLIAAKGTEILAKAERQDERLYRENEPDFALPDGDSTTYLFYLGTDNPGHGIFYEFVSSKFIEAARDLRKAGKAVYVVTRNMVTPSYGELTYEEARREGIVFVHLEEDETVSFDGKRVCVAREGRELIINAGTIVRFDDYAELFKDREFLSLYRSEPQLRWSPTKWGRKKYHVGFIRHPRAKRWERREILGALGEMTLDHEEDRVLPQVNEERCSGCGSCKEACPASAIEMEIREKQIAIFGPMTSAGVPIAHVQEDTCIGCGLCASTCPSQVIAFEAHDASGSGVRP
jgi:heterodisulfide reductase subunit A-like polyferredoxin